MPPLPLSGLVGRAVGALGALVLFISTFLDVTGPDQDLNWHGIGSLGEGLAAIGALGFLVLVASVWAARFTLPLVGLLLGMLALGIVFGVLLQIEFEDLGENFDFGYWLALISALALALGSGLAFFSGRSLRAEEAPARAPTPAPTAVAPSEPVERAAPAAPAAPAPGWYSDPSDETQLRWWTGNEWGSDTRPR